MAGQIDLNGLWQHVTKQVQDRVMLPSLWGVLGAARPIVIEGDKFVLGFGTHGMHHSGILLENRHRNLIEQILAAATNQRLRIQVIPGETLEDWEASKQQEVELRRMQEATQQAREEALQAGQTWDAVADRLIRRYNELPNRSLSAVQGQYLEEAVEVLVDAYRRLMPAQSTEVDVRNYSRALDRVAERSGVPGAVVGYLVRQGLARS